MISTDPFQTLAEFGVAIAGFTSVVVVFGRGAEPLHPADRFRVFTALVPSLGGSFLALVPVGLDLFGLSEVAIWRTASVIYAVLFGTIMSIALRALGRLPTDAKALFHPVVRSFFLALWVISFGVALVNASGLFFEPHPGVYFFVVMTALLLGAVSFARIVFVRPGQTEGGVDR
jgi:hypothetical protein